VCVCVCVCVKNDHNAVTTAQVWSVKLKQKLCYTISQPASVFSNSTEYKIL